MRFFLIFLFFFLLQNCSKPKTVLICGDHVCINKSEAKQYFEENLSIEVKIIDKKRNKNIDLVELNLIDKTENRQVSIDPKKKTKEEIKILTNDEIDKIKAEIILKKKQKNFSKLNKKKQTVMDNTPPNKKENEKGIINKIAKKIGNKEKIYSKKIPKDDKKIIKQNNNSKENVNVNKKRKNVADVCTIIKKCSIDEISKFLLEQGKNKKFPDITTRE